MANKLDPKLLQGTIEHLYAWCLAEGLLDDQVDPAEVAKIVKRYEGMVESEPFPLLVVEPEFVEKRKSLVVS